MALLQTQIFSLMLSKFQMVSCYFPLVFGNLITNHDTKCSYDTQCLSLRHTPLFLNWFVGCAWIYFLWSLSGPNDKLGLGSPPRKCNIVTLEKVIAQRLLASKDLTHAKMGCILIGYLKLLPLWIFVFPGMASRVLFPDEVTCAHPDLCEEICQSR